MLFDTYFTSPATGRYYSIAANGLAEWIDDGQDYDPAEAEAERRAEFAMSWVCGGGRAEDISTAYLLGLGR